MSLENVTVTKAINKTKLYSEHFDHEMYYKMKVNLDQRFSHSVPLRTNSSREIKCPMKRAKNDVCAWIWCEIFLKWSVLIYSQLM